MHNQRSYGVRTVNTLGNGEVKNLQRSLDRYMGVQEVCFVVLSQGTFAVMQKGELMALIETERLLKKIKNEYERAEVARWVNAEEPISITWSDKTARKTKLYCRKSGYLCEFATEYGYCQITMCVKEPLAGRRTDG